MKGKNISEDINCYKIVVVNEENEMIMHGSWS
jgi:hypothetical protein